MTRGYFLIGVYQPKHPVNIGTLWRSAYQLGAAGIFTVGKRYSKQASDTVKAWRHVPYYEYESFEDFQAHRALDCPLICIETGGGHLRDCMHPERAAYLLGAEDYGLPDLVLKSCQKIIGIESLRTESYNVAVAGTIVMYHRALTRGELK